MTVLGTDISDAARLGIHRSLEPPTALPHIARRLDAALSANEYEAELAAEMLAVDATSFADIRRRGGAEPEAMASIIAGIVAEHGKIQNPATDSRTLRFRGATGATAFVGFLRTHLDSYVGSYARTRGYTSRGRSGFLAVAQACRCHLANPTYLAAVSARGTVTWLEINGPGATRRRLAALLARAP